ncbi:MAG: hypothetical protein MR426_06030, partial [Clostridiales bacterium]|nr:hypothetical protein [Clostridiales bacterium]
MKLNKENAYFSFQFGIDDEVDLPVPGRQLANPYVLNDALSRREGRLTPTQRHKTDILLRPRTVTEERRRSCRAGVDTAGVRGGHTPAFSFGPHERNKIKILLR